VRPALWVVIGAVLLAGTVAACRDFLPTNRFLRMRTLPNAGLGTGDARHKFDHARHGDVLARGLITCGDCHRFDARIETSDSTLAAAMSGAALLPGGSACHYCHGPSDTRLAEAPSACTTCHSNLSPLLPEDHQIAWLRVHASVASADPAACQNCHRDAFCINCHQNRDSILTFVHDRNFISFHSVDARANPIQCGNCHRVDFCTNCHARAIR
jgi:nitrate/TMAO reductase-like tetraheme cytochrome c subunit